MLELEREFQSQFDGSRELQDTFETKQPYWIDDNSDSDVANFLQGLKVLNRTAGSLNNQEK